MSDAAARVPRRLVGDRVAELLREAGAPDGPWDGDKQLLDNAAELINSAMQLAKLGESLSEYWEARGRAQKAVRELDIVLPKIITIESEMMRVLRFFNFGDFAAKYVERRAATAKLLDALFDFGTARSIEKFFTHWHTTATIAFLAFQKTVGEGSKSKAGPAVRFVRLVLIEVGQKTHTLEAIESALRSPHNFDFAGDKPFPLFG